MTVNRQPLGIYIHIPFCVKKCSYCDFLSFPDAELNKINSENRVSVLSNCTCQADDIKDKYLEMLKKDIEETVTSVYEKEYAIDTVFIGGGTPSSLSVGQLEKLCKTVQHMLHRMGDEKAIEITMECNPGTLNDDKVKVLKDYGINRISLGLQSANDRELQMLGRIHSYDDFLKSYELLEKYGFDNINVDIMSALPCQTVDSYEDTLQKIARLSPRHISAYSLIIEEGTLFYEKYAEDEKLRQEGKSPLILPDEESERAMYELTEEILNKYGYNRYEISNYAKSGYECRHNAGYWQGKAYVGVGLGAASYIRNENDNKSIIKRFSKTKNLHDYLNGDFGEYEVENLSRDMQMEEFMFLGLRMMEGISIKKFQGRFDVSIYDIYQKQLNKLTEEGLIEIRDDIICLTKRGIDVSNYVFEEFLLCNS